MKHIRKFNESSEDKKKISFDEAKEWLKENYTDLSVAEMIDDEIFSGNWIDYDQMEDEGYESEYDYYVDYGHGEAESAVIERIINDLKSNFELDFDTIGDDTNIYDFLRTEFDINDF